MAPRTAWATTTAPASTAPSYASRETPSTRAASASRAASGAKSEAGQAPPRRARVRSGPPARSGTAGRREPDRRPPRAVLQDPRGRRFQRRCRSQSRCPAGSRAGGRASRRRGPAGARSWRSASVSKSSARFSRSALAAFSRRRRMVASSTSSATSNDGREEHQQAGAGDPAGVRQQHEYHGDRCDHEHVAAERPSWTAPSDAAKNVGGVDGGEPGVGGIGDRLAAPDGGVDASPAGASGARCHTPSAGCLEQGRAHARVIGSQEPVL